MSLMDEIAEGVKCEDLEKVIVDDDLEKKKFKLEPNYLLRRRKS